MQLLSEIFNSGPDWLRQIPSVESLRQTWVHQYFGDEGQVRQVSAKDLPPAGQRYDSPYDPQARYGNKRSTTWTGYKVHLTETCDENSIHLITHVETTQAHISYGFGFPGLRMLNSTKTFLLKGLQPSGLSSISVASQKLIRISLDSTRAETRYSSAPLRLTQAVVT